MPRRKTPRIIAIFMAAVFAAGELLLPAEAPALAPPSRIDDLAGIEHKDIGELKLWLAFLIKMAPQHFLHDAGSVGRVLASLGENRHLLSPLREPQTDVRLGPVTLTEEGRFALRIRRADATYGQREYVAEFETAEDIEIYPAGKSRARSAADREALRRYEEVGERLIDDFIGRRIRGGDFVELAEYTKRGKGVKLIPRFDRLGWQEKYRGRQLRRPARYLPAEFLAALGERIDPFLARYGTSVERAFAGKNVVFIVLPYTASHPSVVERDADGIEREIRITAHSSAHAVYFFVREDDVAIHFDHSILSAERGRPRALRRELDALIDFAALAETAVHEIGVMAGLPSEVVERDRYYQARPHEARAHALRNELDSAYAYYRRYGFTPPTGYRTRLQPPLPEPFDASPVDLNLRSVGRDYAAGAVARTPEDPTAIGVLRGRIARLADRAASSGDGQTAARLSGLARLDADALVTAVAAGEPAWKEASDALLEADDLMSDLPPAHPALRDIRARAALLDRYRFEGIPVSSVLSPVDGRELKEIAQVGMTVRRALADAGALPARKVRDFLKKLRGVGAIDIGEWGAVDFARAARIARDAYQVPVAARDGSIAYYALITYDRPGLFRRSSNPRVAIVTAAEMAWARALVRSPGDSRAAASLVRDPGDSGLIDAYIAHEETIDRVIAAAMESADRHHPVVEKGAIHSISEFEERIVSMLTSVYGFHAGSLSDRFRRAISPYKHQYMLIDAGAELPSLPVADPAADEPRRLAVRTHTSPRNVTYLFLTHDEYGQAVRGLADRGRSLEPYYDHFVHEAGVRLGLPWQLTDDLTIVNELDLAWRIWQAQGVIFSADAFPTLRELVAVPKKRGLRGNDMMDLHVDLDDLRPANGLGERVERDYASAKPPDALITRLHRASADAVEAERELFSPPARRYTAIVPSALYRPGELERHRTRFATLFDIETSSGRTAEQYYRNILEKAAARAPGSTVALVTDDMPVTWLERLSASGVRFLRVDAARMRDLALAPEDEREAFQIDAYAIMLLARHIGPDAPADSPVQRLLLFYLKNHFRFEGDVDATAYIEAIKRADPAVLIRGILLCRPIITYDLLNYHRISRTILASA